MSQFHCYNPVAPAYLIWAYYAHGRQRRCQEDPVGLRSGRLEKTTGSSPHHMAQHHLTGSETSPSYAARSIRFGSEPPSVEDDVDIWRYSIVSCMPETTRQDGSTRHSVLNLFVRPFACLLSNLWTWYFKNEWTSFDDSLRKCSTRQGHKMIEFWGQEVKDQGHIDPQSAIWKEYGWLETKFGWYSD